MVINNDKKEKRTPRSRFPRFYVFPRKHLLAHMWISRGHVTRVKQVSRIAPGEGTRAGCREMISLLRESRERSASGETVDGQTARRRRHPRRRRGARSRIRKRGGI